MKKIKMLYRLLFSKDYLVVVQHGKAHYVQIEEAKPKSTIEKIIAVQAFLSIEYEQQEAVHQVQEMVNQDKK